jgi:glucosamine--fructose-6-phosphate aminotransferase (isomerizing)
MSLSAEIFEQPAVLQHLLDTQSAHAAEIARAINARGVEYVFLAARGTSDHAGIYAQYLWGARNRLPVALAAPSLFTLYHGSPRLGKALVVGISQSGRSPDIVQVLAEGRRQGALTLAVTNAPDSELAQAAEFTLDVSAGEERAVAATKTYTAELLALAMLSAALEDSPAALDALRGVPAAVETALGLDGAAEQAAARHAALQRCVVLGRGYHYGTALEWALKMKELAYVLADAYSAADFQHGPVAIVERGFPVLALAPRGAVLEDMLSLLSRLRAEQGAEILALSDDPAVAALADIPLHLPIDLPEWLFPLAGIVPAQLYCYHLTRAKGYDTEQPRGLHKITRTR